MKISIRLFGDLRRFLAPGQDTLEVVLSEGSTVHDLIRTLNLPHGEIWVVSINGTLATREQDLKDGDKVEIFAPVGGG
ncbi:MAG: MoaD/ThiS family protein [Chloroflexi bacterium]|nr:MoaD/ThiS family protein [Chloroflexota bacterium]